MIVDPDRVNPLLMLQGYIDGDKHRVIRLASGRTIARRSDQHIGQLDLAMQPAAAGFVTASSITLGSGGGGCYLWEGDHRSDSRQSTRRVRTYGKTAVGGRDGRIDTYRGTIGDARAPENNSWDRDEFQNE
jgi:hypothetical protein